MIYTPEQMEVIKNALYKVNAARQALSELNELMKNKGQWRGQADIAHMVDLLEELSPQDGHIPEFLINE